MRLIGYHPLQFVLSLARKNGDVKRLHPRLHQALLPPHLALRDLPRFQASNLADGDPERLKPNQVVLSHPLQSPAHLIRGLEPRHLGSESLLAYNREPVEPLRAGETERHPEAPPRMTHHHQQPVPLQLLALRNRQMEPKKVSRQSHPKSLRAEPTFLQA